MDTGQSQRTEKSVTKILTRFGEIVWEASVVLTLG
jgi:hypothetical protein